MKNRKPYAERAFSDANKLGLAEAIHYYWTLECERPRKSDACPKQEEKLEDAIIKEFPAYISYSAHDSCVFASHLLRYNGEDYMIVEKGGGFILNVTFTDTPVENWAQFHHTITCYDMAERKIKGEREKTADMVICGE